jgi:hypothetical protein
MPTKSKKHTDIEPKQAPRNAKTALTPKQQHEVRFLKQYLPYLRGTTADLLLREDFRELRVVRRALKEFHWHPTGDKTKA